MNRLGIVAVFGLSSIAAVVAAMPGEAQSSYTGIVERVWEDGFRLNTGNRTFNVDSWDVHGDNTAQHIRVGDRVTVTGEFAGGGFDAFSISGSASVAATPSDVQGNHAQGSHTGIVERVWEDGFRLNAGNRTFRVDSWNVHGDNTAQHIRVGDRVTVTGEFDSGEFDAFTIQVMR